MSNCLFRIFKYSYLYIYICCFVYFFFIDPESSLEWRVCIPCEGPWTQIGVAGIWWKSFDAWWFPGNGRDTTSALTQRTREPSNSSQKLPTSTKKVSWVCLSWFCLWMLSKYNFYHPLLASKSHLFAGRCALGKPIAIKSFFWPKKSVIYIYLMGSFILCKIVHGLECVEH